MDELNITLYGMTVFTFAFLLVALVEEYRWTLAPAKKRSQFRTF
jgi:hypothetical protein